MRILEISLSERFKIGPLLGWAYYTHDEQEDFYELNIYLIFIMLRLTWEYEKEI